MKKIQDYAVIGNCRSAALVSTDGSIDWLCWPRFDSDPIFANLLDRHKGQWAITPTDYYKVDRQYIPRTNVLQTTFTTTRGKMVITDLMPVMSENEKLENVMAEHEILRKVECIQGQMDVRMLLSFFAKEGATPFEAFKNETLGIRAHINSGVAILRSSIPLANEEKYSLCTHLSLKAKDTVYFSLTFAQESPAVLPIVNSLRDDSIVKSVRWWRSFAAGIQYKGPYREMVIRSALFLKLMSYAPSGAIIAAPTTSLPERIGGNLNWDYRFCWLRDASMTVTALMKIGLTQEAEAFVNWLLHATHLTRPKLNVLYDIFGRKPRRETVIQEFQGYFNSAPVRFGNEAAQQHQLDLYGEVIHGAKQVLSKEEKLDKTTQGMLKDLGDYICKHWQEEDAGMWEVRGKKEFYTHSLLLCWRGVKDLVDMYHHGQIEKLDIVKFESAQNEMAKTIQKLAWNEKLQSFTSTLRGEKVDANLLLLPWYQFLPWNSWRMSKTYQRIKEELAADNFYLDMAGNGLLFRNNEQKEGAFILCGFWATEYLARGGGSLEEAQELFEYMLSYTNDVGLLSEEVHPVTGDLLGNFPLTFSHMGLVNAALAIHDRELKEVDHHQEDEDSRRLL